MLIKIQNLYRLLAYHSTFTISAKVSNIEKNSIKFYSFILINTVEVFQFSLVYFLRLLKMISKYFTSVFLLNIFLNFSSGFDFKFQNVSVQIISENQAINYHENRASETYYLNEDKWYTGGDRIKGDSIRSDISENYEFDEIRDFHLELKYPKQNDFYITHVSAFVQQSSSLGKAYIVDGGIGKTNLFIYSHLNDCLIFQVILTCI